MTGIHVLAAPLLDPGCARVDVTLPAGLTIADILATALPGTPPADRLRVLLVTDSGASEVLPALWRRVRPRPGVRVVIRVLAGRDALRSILMIAVSIAAFAIGQWWAVSVLGLSGLAASAVATGVAIGATVVGHLLVNALIPPVKPKILDAQNRYSISGWRNEVRQNGAIPDVLGAIRYAPPFAALSYSEIVGDWQYIRAVFIVGVGEIETTDFRIGDTSLSEYDEVEIEVRTGLATDAPLSLYPRQIVEESVGAELTRPLPRDDLGEVISGEPAEEKPVVRASGADASGASVILAWPAGLVRYTDDGDAIAHTVSVRIQHRLVTAEEWQDVTTLEINARRLEAFYRQHTWTFPSRGRWQVRCIMQTDETTDSKIQQRTVWAALQTIRPEYPLAYHAPLALIALRVKATHQLNGSLDTFNCVVSRVCRDYDAASGTWIDRATRNPASLFRHVLQNAANARAVGGSGIDLAALADWHTFCDARGLRYDRVLDDTSTTLRDILTEIAAAGRATPRHDGLKWSVVIDRPQDLLVVDHLSPRNSSGFRAVRTYIDPPHAFRVKFQDATNDNKDAERLIRWPGYTGDITLTEELTLPGICAPDQVWRAARRRQREALHRPDTYEVTQPGMARVATRGDLVALSTDILSQVQVAARVRAVSGSLIELDEPVTMTDGTYAIRFRTGVTTADTIGESVVRTVVTRAGTHTLITLSGPGSGPAPVSGDLVHFGVAGAETRLVIIREIESAESDAALIRCVDAAPEIDILTDAETPPPWSGRVGAEVPETSVTPAAPRFTSVRSGWRGDGALGRVRYLIEPGPGGVTAATFEVQHRLVGASAWETVSIPVANGGGALTVYATGDDIALRARALSASGTAGPYTAILGLRVGAGDAAIPGELPESRFTATAILGGAVVRWWTGDDPGTTRVQVYRSTSATLDRATDAVGDPVPVVAGRKYSLILGDETRETLLSDGWDAGGGWTVAGDIATHSPGAAGGVSRDILTAPGRWYRIAFTASVVAGVVTPALGGGSDRPGTARAASGIWTDRIQAVSGNDCLVWHADTAFEGAVSDPVAYLETAACLAQGRHYIWVEPQTDAGTPGPISGPISIDVI